MSESIPLVDIGLQHEAVREQIERGWADVVSKTSFILGAATREFEEAFAAFSGVRHCVGVASGTDALELALRAVGVGSGDEVVLPANTFIATALAVTRAGARPVLVDAEPGTYLMDVERAAAAVGPRTKAVMPVHLFGQMAQVEALQNAIGEAVLVEDAAQCQGATRLDKPAGTFGAVAGTSFYPGKNLGAYGDAGAVLTSEDDLAASVRALRNYGSEQKYNHPEIGFNSRLDTLQAVVLKAKLEQLPSWNEQRRAAAARYDELLGDLEEVQLPLTLEGNVHVWHLYVVCVPRRDDVLAKLHAAGIGAGVHYPVPIHLQGAYSEHGHTRGDFPITEAAADRMISLPIYPGITESQQERVAEELRKALG